MLQHNKRIQLLDPSLPEQLTDLAQRLQDLCFDSMISIPDVVIWLMCEDKRLAYLRVPIVDIFYAEGLGCGSSFGAVQTSLMNLPKAQPKSVRKREDIPAQVQFRAWFGPQNSQVCQPI